jgi:transcription elongation GreA/GreB family factor
MRAEFEKLAAQNKIYGRHVEPLVALTTSGYCLHKHWGFGKITTVDTVFARFLIDFKDRPAHQMDLSFAADFLKPIPSDHILARKANNLEELRQLAALHHLDLIKLVLNSQGGKASLDQIQKLLVPDIIRDDWKKWWEAARVEMKKDGHFIIPLKKTDPILYQAESVSLQDRLLEEFRAAKGLKARNAVAQELAKSIEDVRDKAAAATEVITSLNAEITNYQRTQPATALEAIFVRGDLRDATGVAAAPEEITAAMIWAQPDIRLGGVLEAAPAARHRRILLSFRDAHPGTWSEAVLLTINAAPAKLVGELAHLLIHEDRLHQLKDTLARLISHHQASSELLLWLAKERSDAFADILGPEVFRAMLTSMERDQFNEKKSNRLRDFIVDDGQLLVELISSADIDVIKDLIRALQLSPCFDDMDKRSLLARIVKSYPDMQSLITPDQTKQDNYYIVSWGSLERRRNEYQELVQKKIPANSKEISIARSYGDLRENHEYKAAKETQKLLMRRKSELEQQILHARGTDFLNVRTDVASIGTKVNVTELGSQITETFSILGAWDTDPDNNIVSYLTPLAKVLIGRKVGEEVEFEMGGPVKHYRINSIVPCLEAATDAAATPPAQAAAPAAELPSTPAAEPAASAPGEAAPAVPPAQ